MTSFNTIVAAFCIAGLTLIFALAYNIGGTAEESRAMKMGAITRQRMDSVRERLNLCIANNQEFESGKASKETKAKFLQETSDLLSSENKMFKQQYEEGVRVLQDCTQKLEELREERTGTKATNATLAIKELDDEKSELEEAIKKANATKEYSRYQLRRLIQAYRLEVNKLAMVLGKRQTESLRRATESRQKQQQQSANGTATTTAAVMNNGEAKVSSNGSTAVAEASVSTAVVDKQGQQSVADCSTNPFLYSIMFDAGSTGSRVHVFNFTVTNGTLSLNDELYEHLKPGLSAYTNETEAAESIRPLLEKAVAYVPKEFQRCTTLALKATAGLRLLGKEKSESILATVDALFKTYPFVVGKDAAVVMDGSDEGPYAWLTVNFLLGNLATGKTTVAVLDLGGGSTQVVFQPDTPATLSNTPDKYLYSAAIRGVNVKAYQHSYLGLGLKEAGKAIVAAARERSIAPFLCFPPGYNETVNGVTVSNDAANASFASCAEHIAAHVVQRSLTNKTTGEAICDVAPCAFNGVHQPDITQTFTGDVYAFSYFYDRMEPFLPDDGVINVGTFKSIGTSICESDEEKFASKNKGTMCMDFAFLYTLLHHGYGLADDRTLYIKKKINGVETAWPLGAALAVLG